MRKIGILNGPNLGRLGRREPSVYGKQSLEELERALRADAQTLGVYIESFQSNHEGKLIDQIERWTDAGFYGMIINPGGLTHTSIVLRDAICASGLTVVEVHISNIYRREDFRQKSLSAGVCVGVVSGLGMDGYHAALYHLGTRSSSRHHH
ncbi:MAG: type II 3-dehydroquinate dehydratase [Puniceicoccales bacterium]|jgi:3-dehydroquinate dehydratase-2|nr:type II 3-dehydroquinate dehydratase [Puniceicoccales bacterium]